MDINIDIEKNSFLQLVCSECRSIAPRGVAIVNSRREKSGEDTHHNRVDIILDIRGMDAAAFSRTLPAPLLGIVDPNDPGAPGRLHRYDDFCGVWHVPESAKGVVA